MNQSYLEQNNRQRQQQNIAIALGVVAEFINNCSNPVSAVEIACALELPVPLVEAELTRLEEKAIIKRDRIGDWSVAAPPVAEHNKIARLQPVWRNNGWYRLALEEYLYSYYGICGCKQLQKADESIIAQIEQDLINEKIKQEFICHALKD